MVNRRPPPHLFPTVSKRITSMQAVQRAAKLIKNSRQINHDDAAAKRELDHTIDETSRRVLAWAEGAAAAAAAVAGGEDENKDRQRQALPSGEVGPFFFCFCWGCLHRTVNLGPALRALG